MTAPTTDPIELSEVEAAWLAYRDEYARANPWADGRRLGRQMRKREFVAGYLAQHADLNPKCEHGIALSDLCEWVDREVNKDDEADLSARLARVDALVGDGQCWVTRSVEACTSYIGAKFDNGAEWTAGMCCLPCRVRAALAEVGP